MKIVALSGSLRHGAYNTALLKTAAKLLPNHCTLEFASIDLPLYSEDLEGEDLPKDVQQFKQQIASADRILISSPEYNHSFSGVLKNALDWGSRPAFESPFKGKHVAILTAAKSPVGGARAQAQLRLVLASMLCHVYAGPEYLLPNAHEKFNSEGVLVDETSRQRLLRLLESFISD